MKKLFSLFLTCISVLSAMADDGGTLYPQDWTYGNIYVKKPNSSIALEKEFMYVSGEKIKADFCFRNTTDSTVIVPCAFPVIIKAHLWYEDDNIVIGDFREETDIDFWKIILDKKNLAYTKEYFGSGFYGQRITIRVTEQEIENYDKKLRVLTYSDYQSKLGISNQENIYNGCSIIQDGNAVELKNVGVETNVNIREGKIELVLHFYHELMFPPNALSKVSVEYKAKTLKEFEEDGNNYEVYYDISTGGTWKGGTIGSFVLLTDYSMKDADTKKDVESLQTTRIIPYTVYSTRNYKPKGRFVFGGYAGYRYEVYKRYFPGGNYNYSVFIDLEAMSLSKNSNGDFYLNKGTNNQFHPFVIDSVINFSVNEPCVGPFVANGFVDVDNSEKNKEMFSFYYYVAAEPEMFTLQRDSVWNLYSRIKTSTLTNVDDGWTKTLKFKDLFPAYPYKVASEINDGWYGSNANYDVALLRPGSYKFEVNDIYKGDSTQSVGLSHIWFYPVDKTLLSMVDEDSESEIPLFSNLWAQLLVIHVTDEKPLLGQADYDKYLEERKEAQENFEKWKREDEERERKERRLVHRSQTDEESKSSYVIPITVGATAAGALLFTAIFILRKRRKNKQKR